MTGYIVVVEKSFANMDIGGMVGSSVELVAVGKPCQGNPIEMILY